MNTGNKSLNLSQQASISYEQLLLMTNCLSTSAIAVSGDQNTFCVNDVLADILEAYGVRQASSLINIFGEKNKNIMKAALSELEHQAAVQLTIKYQDQVLMFNFSRMGQFDESPILIIGQDCSAYEKEIKSIQTNVKNLEVALEEQNHELSTARDRAMAANRAKSGFLANMSHELRTPLNAIIGYSEIMLEDIDEVADHQTHADLSRIKNAGKHLLTLINDILDLSKIEAGKMGLNLEYFRVDGMIREVLETIEPMAAKNNTSLVLQENEDIGVMLSDITKVRQILFNLISNGIKFSEHGEVTIDCQRAEVDDKEHVVIKVTDTGIGMSPDDLEKLFEEFFQVDNSNAKKWSGTGLGLVISQRFSQMMGGSISVASELGKGSTFTVTIPINTAKIRFQDSPDGFVVGPKVDPRLVRFAGKAEDIERRDKISRVLVIDDDPDVRDLMERYLSREGFEVMSAGSGRDGIENIKAFDPDVITLDVLMPVMDGWSVLSELKNNPETASIPVIMLSMLDELDMSFALGASDYLLKPIKRDVLVDTVLKHIRDKDNATVLVVDDLENNRNMISRTLSSQNINVALACNGIEALESLERSIPELILLDLMMPEMDGFKFSEIVNKDDRFKDIPIVVLTAQELSEDDLERLSGNVERIYEKNETDFESLLIDIQKMVTSTVRQVYLTKKH